MEQLFPRCKKCVPAAGEKLSQAGNLCSVSWDYKVLGQIDPPRSSVRLFTTSVALMSYPPPPAAHPEPEIPALRNWGNTHLVRRPLVDPPGILMRTYRVLGITMVKVCGLEGGDCCHYSFPLFLLLSPTGP